MEFDRTRDAALGFAIIVSLGLGLLSLWATFVVAISLALRTGILKIHLLEPPAPHTDEGLILMGILLLSVSTAVVIAFAAFRSIKRLGEARARNE
jgi:hypothetical protein